MIKKEGEEKTLKNKFYPFWDEYQWVQEEKSGPIGYLVVVSSPASNDCKKIVQLLPLYNDGKPIVLDGWEIVGVLPASPMSGRYNPNPWKNFDKFDQSEE